MAGDGSPSGAARRRAGRRPGTVGQVTSLTGPAGDSRAAATAATYDRIAQEYAERSDDAGSAAVTAGCDAAAAGADVGQDEPVPRPSPLNMPRRIPAVPSAQTFALALPRLSDELAAIGVELTDDALRDAAVALDPGAARRSD